MVPCGRTHSGKSGKPSMVDQPKKAFDFEKEDEDLSGSEDVADEKTPVIEKYVKKRSGGLIEDVGGEVQNMLEKFGR